MKKYVASSENAELTGSSLSSLATNLLADAIRPILEKYSLSQIEPDRWYPQQLPLDILFETKTQSHEPLALVAVGQQVIEVIEPSQLPPISSFFEGVSLLTSIYDLNHRNKAEHDRIIVTQVNPKLIQVTNATPYPDDLIYGYTHSIVRRFAGRDLSPTVKYANVDQVDSDENMIISIDL